jgi:flagellar motility protein MotE (MotC chaperone)
MNEVTTVVGGGSVLFAYTVIVSIFFRLLNSERKENRRLEADAERSAARVDAERDARRKMQDAHNEQMQTLYGELAELRKQLADQDIVIRRLEAKIEGMS